jgi:Transposase
MVSHQVLRVATANAMDEVRRRVQQDTLHRRGHRDDPLYKIRGLLRHGAENLSERQIARLDAALDAGDPDYEVTVAWHCYQQLRSIYHATHEGAYALVKTLPIPPWRSSAMSSMLSAPAT